MSIVKAADEHTPHSVIAAVDIGSNSIKMTVARLAEDGSLDEFLWRSETVRLGHGIEATGSLAADRVEAGIATLVAFADEARDAGATRLLGVATEATRVASNGQAFLDDVIAKTGLEVQSISGDREAQLTFLGLQGTVDLSGDIAVADIGGGSTELILARDETVIWSVSLPLGSGRLTDRFVKADPPAIAEGVRCREAAAEMISDAPLRDVTGGRLIIVGGTGEYMDRLIAPSVERTPEEIEDLLLMMSGIPAADLARLVGIPVARARVLPAGIAIASAIATEMQPRRFETAQSGIRRGLLLAAFAGEL